MPRAIQAICYVDFVGDLRTTACGLELGAGLADFDGPVTVYLSSATCPGCRARIAEKVARQLSGSGDASVSSSTLRMSSGVMPAPLRNTPAP